VKDEYTSLLFTMIVCMNRLLLLFVIIVDSLSSARSHGRRGFLNPIRIQPTAGEPWPKPQSIQTTTAQLAIYPHSFRFLINETTSSERCDLLTGAFERYYRAIFFPQTYLSYILRSSSSSLTDDYTRPRRSSLANVSLLEDLYVNVQQPCEQWPSLESNESCNRLF
jgi:hypothetical protein